MKKFSIILFGFLFFLTGCSQYKVPSKEKFKDICVAHNFFLIHMEDPNTAIYVQVDTRQAGLKNFETNEETSVYYNSLLDAWKEHIDKANCFVNEEKDNFLNKGYEDNERYMQFVLLKKSVMFVNVPIEFKEDAIGIMTDLGFKK